MKTLDRRTLLKSIAAAGATAAVGPSAVEAAAKTTPQEDMAGLLFDATKCVGCQACVASCRDANEVAYGRQSTLQDTNVDLSANTKNIIKLARQDGQQGTFMKMQCMHCIEPACVSACMFGSLQKREHGIVTWKGDRCTGCRYCQVACPFGVPKFEWESRNPEIVKCELCRHRLAEGGIPACAEVCPRDAVIYGKRPELLEEARRRIAGDPELYLPKIYGEHDGGGTQVLYISHIPFTALGLPALDDRPVPETLHKVQGRIYKGFIAPIAAYAVLVAAIKRNHAHGHDDEQAVHQKEDV
jgi:Fe-S-cluster-containing dehydrogenase component